MESDYLKMERIKLFNQRYCWDMCNEINIVHSNFDNFIIYSGNFKCRIHKEDRQNSHNSVWEWHG